MQIKYYVLTVGHSDWILQTSIPLKIMEEMRFAIDLGINASVPLANGLPETGRMYGVRYILGEDGSTLLCRFEAASGEHILSLLIARNNNPIEQKMLAKHAKTDIASQQIKPASPWLMLPAPYCAVALHPGYAAHMDKIGWIKAYEEAIAAAWVFID